MAFKRPTAGTPQKIPDFLGTPRSRSAPLFLFPRNPVLFFHTTAAFEEYGCIPFTSLPSHVITMVTGVRWVGFIPKSPFHVPVRGWPCCAKLAMAMPRKIDRKPQLKARRDIQLQELNLSFRGSECKRFRPLQAESLPRIAASRRQASVGHGCTRMHTDFFELVIRGTAG